ncbi:hypothetical protein [Streptomyces sp. NPDC008121]|uniref:hypothetical protein n=1 Tax=Streptomyces sp. NPDC008121 TaxID=3364809 RepID=UPI0036EB2CE3
MYGAPAHPYDAWGGGAVPPPPVGPPRVPPPPGEARPAQAALAGLLNLSCLGLGYVLLRQWALAAVCWAATAVLLLLALPADVDGVPTGVLVGYGLFLLAAAADGARRGLRAPARSLALPAALPIALALALLVVPVGGTLAYGAARDEAVEQSLLDRLAAADALVKSAEGQSFSSVQADYREALLTYQDLGTRRAGSRAGRLVPDRLDAYYAAVSAPYGSKNYCEAVPRLQHLRGLPSTVDRALLGDLAGKADEPLAHSWYACGTSRIGVAGAEATAAEQLNALLSTFPQSPHATKVETAVRESIRSREATLNGSAADPCDTVTELRRVGTTVDLLPRPAFAALSRANGEAVGKGDFACGVRQFRDKKYTDAIGTMTEYTKQHPGSPQAAHARSIAIAAEIAAEDAAAGKRLPPATAPGGARMVMVVSNDGPGEVELLYTGPVTGRVTIKACGTCKAYQGSLARNAPKIKACSGPSSKYPKTTITLPAGSYHLLQKRDATGTTSPVNKSSTATIEPGYSYTNCLYVTTGFGF